jgi:hypothetical protein
MYNENCCSRFLSQPNDKVVNTMQYVNTNECTCNTHVSRYKNKSGRPHPLCDVRCDGVSALALAVDINNCQCFGDESGPEDLVEDKDL